MEGHGVFPSETRPVWEELRSGIQLCAVLSRVKRVEEIAGCQMEYSKAMAALVEWKNLEAFVFEAQGMYETKLSKFPCEAADLFNYADVPRFLAFVCAFARVDAPELFTPPYYEGESDAFEFNNADAQGVETLKIGAIERSLASLDEKVQHWKSPVYSWLETIELQEYFSVFEENGFDSLERISMMDDNDVDQIIPRRKTGHAKHLRHAIHALARSGQYVGLANAMQVGRLPEFYSKRGIVQAMNASFVDDMTASSGLLADTHRSRLERLKLQNFGEKSKAGKVTSKSTKVFKQATRMAAYLFSTIAFDLPAIVLDFASDGTVWAGLAGETYPRARTTANGISSVGIAMNAIAWCWELSGISLSSTDAKARKLFICGITPNLAIAEFANLKGVPGIYMCGPKYTAALSLRAVGLLDGICMDVEASGLTRAAGVREGQAIPGGVAMGHVYLKEGDQVRESALCALVLKCLSECGFKGKVARGGLIVNGTTFSGSSVSTKFSAGVLTPHSSSRWSACSQIAIHPDFQHRWSRELTLVEEPMFPLISLESRVSMAKDALDITEFLEQVIKDEEALKLEKINAVNASSGKLVTLSLTNVNARAQDTVRPPRSKNAPGKKVSEIPQTSVPIVDVLLAEISPWFAGDDGAIMDLRAFALGEYLTNSKSDLFTGSLSKIYNCLPEELKAKCRHKMGDHKFDDDDNVSL